MGWATLVIKIGSISGGRSMLSRQLVAVDRGIVDCVKAENGQTLYFPNDTFPIGRAGDG